ncbi:MAG: winged helix-turn-helix transcriptional regulator [archaeon]
MGDLDKKDRDILASLYHDARMMISTLAKKTRIQRDSVKYRLSRLKERGIISGMHAALDYEALGFPVLYQVEINLQNFNLEIEEAFIAYLSEYPHVIYLAELTGKFDLSVLIAAKGPADFHAILKDIRSRYPEVMRDHEISTINAISKHWDYTGLLRLMDGKKRKDSRTGTR